MTREPYAYVGNNPLNGVDPTGLYWGEGLVNTVVEVGGEIIRHPGDAAKDAGKGAANFGVGFANAALGTSFAGFCGEGQSWSRNIGSATFWIESALAARGAVATTRGAPTYEVIARTAPGRDGGRSVHIIERVGGEVVGVTHQVRVDGSVVHQHQRFIGKYGGERYFPSEWSRPFINWP